MFIFPDAGIDPPCFCRSNEDNPLALEVAACPAGVLPHSTPSAAEDRLSTLCTGSGNPGGSQHDRARKSLIPSLVLIFIRLDLLATVDEDGHLVFVCMTQTVPEKNITGGRTKVTLKKQRTVKSDHIKLAELGRAEFIKAWLDVHDLGEQFGPGVHSGPDFKLWWLGSRYVD